MTWTALDRLLVAAAAVLLLFGLGSNSLQNEDEARYALAQQQIVASGNWMDFEVQGQAWFNKAPLRVWASAALGAVVGVNEWTVRLPSALAAIGVIIALMALARQFFDAATGRWAAVVLLTSTQFLYHHCGRTGEMDSALLLAWVLAVLFAAKADEDARWWIASLACVGVAGMVKHAFYVVPVGGVACATLVLTGAWRRVDVRTWWLAVAALAVVVVPWHVAMIARHGDVFVDTYFGREVAGRVVEHVERGHRWLFYPSVIEDGLFPWAYLLPFALIFWPRDVNPRVPWILGIWAVPMIVGPAFAQLDLAWYALPALPAIALVLGRWLSTTSWPPWLGLVSGVLLLLSPSNVMQWNVFDTRAIMGMVGASTFGALRGVELWGPQVAVGGFVVIASLRLWKAPACARRGWILRAWVAFALLHAAVPLRDAFTTSAVETLVQRVTDRGAARHRTIAITNPTDELGDLLGFALRRLPTPVARYDVSTATPPEDFEAAWRVGAEALVRAYGDPPADLVIDGWAALPPDALEVVPQGTVPRDGN